MRHKMNIITSGALLISALSVQSVGSYGGDSIIFILIVLMKNSSSVELREQNSLPIPCINITSIFVQLLPVSCRKPV